MFEQAAGVGNGQGNLVGVLQSVGHKELDTTEQLNSVGATREVGSIPWSGRSPRGRHGNPLQYSCLENPMDRAPWQATDHGVTERQRVGHNMHARGTEQTRLWTGQLANGGNDARESSPRGYT